MRRGAEGTGDDAALLALALDAVARAGDPDARASALEELARAARAAADGARARSSATRPALAGLFAGRAEALARLVPTLDRALGARQPVLVAGEPGAGRTTTAAALHLAGPARQGPLVVAAGPTPDVAGGAERARDGTLIVEEVVGLPRADQAALLRALPEVDGSRLRVVATTCHDLDLAARRGWLDPALRDRLAVLRLRLPPLREEPGAGAAFVRLRLPPDRELDPEATAALVAHPWPGNAREAARVADVLAAWGAARLGPDDVARALLLAGSAAAGATDDTAGLDELERRIVAGRLAAHGWRQAETAASLRIDRKTLWRKIREWGLEPPP
jgi:DNA-binding NtrC family response regulator